jgi:hypothetical protein
MKFSIQERFQAVELLPNSYSLEEYYIKKALKSKLAFSEKEQEELGIALSPITGLTWDKSHDKDVFDIDLTEDEIDFLKACAGTLDKKKLITDLIVSFCERLLKQGA